MVASSEVTVLASESNDDGAKLLAIFILGLGSLVCGLIPVYWTKQQSRPTLITVLLCFGAGVLLATALVHMLPEVRLLLPKYAEVIFCVGYFLIYAVDEFVHLCPSGGAGVSSAIGWGRLNCCSGESVSLINRSNSIAASHTEIENAEAPTDSGSDTPGPTGTFSLLLALCVHSLLEGLAIGVQNSSAKVLLLLGAVSAHKFVVAFCLGVEVSSHQLQHGGRRQSSIVQIVIFSLGSVCGIAIGMALDGLDDTFNRVVIPVLQAVAGGTLLYVTVSEVLPRERGKRKPGEVVGSWQLLAVIAGFIVMTFLSMAISEQ
ncbi:zinc transporter ZIP2-like [Armigeres subalbatus]|uniref:zinc transporter ZIP2-like n=1 Tax=Armigeres subalbatus TaxID=124917 RepID=UPI002ECFC0EA